MIFEPTPLLGAYILKPEPHEDKRGFFSRTFCIQEFEEMGLNVEIKQCSISFNHQRGTFRGMHYQSSPFEEDKIVSCSMGRIWDIIVDLRQQSSSKGQWFGLELSEENRYQLYIPKGFAHGFLTLEDNCQVFYMMTELYTPGYGRGFRWNDPSFDIKLPAPVTMIHDRDANYPNIIL